jgi:hypothetical protein
LRRNQAPGLGLFPLINVILARIDILIPVIPTQNPYQKITIPGMGLTLTKILKDEQSIAKKK